MKPITLSLLILILTLASGYSYARPPHSSAGGDSSSLSDAVSKVKKQTEGRILSANTLNKQGRSVHRIKVLLPNGKVRIIRVNAE